MAGEAKFSDAIAGLAVGKKLSGVSPFSFADDQVKMKLVSRNDKGVVTLDVSLFGVRLGQLTGKPGLVGYRFDDKANS